MVVKITDCMKIEMDIPVLYFIHCSFYWRPYEHAIWKLEGYLNKKVSWNPKKYLHSRIQVYWAEEGREEVIFQGSLMKIHIVDNGEIRRVIMDAVSASWKLDHEAKSRSFQDTAKTYGEIVQESVQKEGGEVIWNKETDLNMKVSTIRYEETTWQFVGRLGRMLGLYVIADIKTGKPNFWFGMRKGKKVKFIAEDENIIWMIPNGKEKGVYYQGSGRTYYQIGDQMDYMGRKVRILEVEGCYEKGEMIFSYVLTEQEVCQPDMESEYLPAGLGLWGRIIGVKGEDVKIALDIDQEKETGDYYYPWYPELGNVLYAMPEIGARALLIFLSANAKDGAVIHCMSLEEDNSKEYQDRTFNIRDENSIVLSKNQVMLEKTRGHRIALEDSSILFKTGKDIKIMAKEKVRLKAKRILMKTPEDLNFYQNI